MESSSSSLTFHDLGLQESFLQALDQLGYQTPTPIQQKTIPLLLGSPQTEIIALAQTGTGKTLAFGLPLLHNITPDSDRIQAIVVCPTRELCVQIAENFDAVTRFTPHLRTVAVYGGTPIGQQMTALKRHCPQVLVATPGRLIDLMERKVVDLSTAKYVVLDEADEMLNMGFRDDVTEIFTYVPEDKSVWLFSATMVDGIRRLARKIMAKSPLEISVNVANTTNRNIAHRYFVTAPEHKYESLKRLLLSLSDFHVLIFCRTKTDTQTVARKLNNDGFDVDYLNGDMAQNERESIMDKYKKRQVNILVATDVAARGIDVANITHVINYELPTDVESYTHRSGRTARAGKLGYCFSLLVPSELFKIQRLNRTIGDTIQKQRVPTPQQLIEAMVENTKIRIKNIEQSSHPNQDKYVDCLVEALPQYDRRDLIRVLLTHFVSTKINEYEQKHDINLAEHELYSGAKRTWQKAWADREERRQTPRSKKPNRCGSSRMLSINVGRKDGWAKPDALNWLSKNLSMPKGVLGKVIIKHTATVFEVEDKFVPRVKKALGDKTVFGKHVHIGYSS